MSYRFSVPLVIPLAPLCATAGAEDRIPAPIRATHPMDALTAVEITAANRILREAGKLGGNTLIVSMTLEEPPKTEVRGWLKGEAFSRRAFAVVMTDGKVGEAGINLDAQTLSSWNV